MVKIRRKKHHFLSAPLSELNASIILDIFKSNNQTSQNIAMGDMDGNGVIDANDASQILELYKINK